jgi:predicted nucleic acid-binding protein
LPANLVVDASVAVKWLLREEHSDRARELRDDAVEGRVRILVPPLFRGEVLNALYQQERRGNVSREGVDDALDRFAAAPFNTLQPEGLLTSALVLARQFSLGATYDAQYLAVAEALEVDLWSADEALIRATASALPWIRWIGDYTAVSD